MVFDPDSVDFKASTIICVCEQCAENYGSCDRFIEYNLAVFPLNKFALRSINKEREPEDDSDNDPDNENVEDFIYPESIVVVPAPEKCVDSVWFIKVLDMHINENSSSEDDYGNIIPAYVKYFAGHFLECLLKKNTLFKLSKMKTFFYAESVIYPYVPMTVSKKCLLLEDKDYSDIINHVQNIKFSAS